MRLVPDYRDAWRWFSVQAFAILAALPLVWLNLPPDIKAFIPPKYGVYIAAAIALGGLVGRLVDQKKPPAA